MFKPSRKREKFMLHWTKDFYSTPHLYHFKKVSDKYSEIKKSPEFRDLKISYKVKLKIRKLFQRAYNLKYLPATSTIKLYIKKFDPKESIHWIRLIEVCLEKIRFGQKTDQSFDQSSDQSSDQKTDQFDNKKTLKEINEKTEKQLIAAVKKHGCYESCIDYINGLSANINYRGRFIGSVKFCLDSGQWRYLPGRYGVPLYADSIESAIGVIKRKAGIYEAIPV